MCFCHIQIRITQHQNKNLLHLLKILWRLKENLFKGIVTKTPNLLLKQWLIRFNLQCISSTNTTDINIWIRKFVSDWCINYIVTRKHRHFGQKLFYINLLCKVNNTNHKHVFNKNIERHLLPITKHTATSFKQKKSYYTDKQSKEGNLILNCKCRLMLFVRFDVRNDVEDSKPDPDAKPRNDRFCYHSHLWHKYWAHRVCNLLHNFRPHSPVHLGIICLYDWTQICGYCSIKVLVQWPIFSCNTWHFYQVIAVDMTILPA